MDNTISERHARIDYRMTAGLLNYFCWLADQDDRFTVTVGQIKTMVERGILEGIYWTEVAEAVGLPGGYDAWE